MADITPERIAELRAIVAADHVGQLRSHNHALAAEAATALRELPYLLDEVERLRAEIACKGCGGTVGDHLAPDQGGCPGSFAIDGVPMVPSAHVDNARAEVERLQKRLKLIADRLAEFEFWEPESYRYADGNARDSALVEWHNHLLRSVKQVRAIARGDV